MVRCATLLLLIIGLMSSAFSEVNGINFHYDKTFQYGIQDGWYEATVKYINYKTAHRGTYTLDVKVQYNSVTAIDFGNGGSIHKGYNNEGYTWSGGTLFFEKNYNGDITAATTTVTTYESDGTRRYEIRIE